MKPAWLPGLGPALMIVTAMALAACGADGEPTKPTLTSSVSVGTGGIKTSATLGVQKGNVAIKIGL